MHSRISPRKMVRNKRDLKSSPHRNRPISRAITRVCAKLDATTSVSNCANVKVVVRVRPPNQKELGSNSRTVVKVLDDNVVIFDPREEDEPFFYHGVQQRGRDLLKRANKNLQFLFDRVFGYEADNAEVFTHSTKNLILPLMDGYNCSVFVYGATGAGKTHTMLGHNENPGITFLTMKELFNQIEIFHSEREFELAITYLEVYNETVKDLLNPGAPLHLRENCKFGVCVSGIKVHRIKSPEELFALLAEGNGNRTQHPTDANAESSRSHAVFQIYVNMQFRNTGQRRIAKLSMIDLAGSERGAATGCSGLRFTEGANINKSLLALGNCINSLADGQRHIPYRDSKLTRILKDSLGGNCQTVMIANISPSSLNYEDTYNTLKYAMRAKKIKSNMTKNVVSSTLTVPQYQKLVDDMNKENERLKKELNEAKSQIPVGPSNITCTCNENKQNDPTVEADSSWKIALQSLLKKKNDIFKQIQKLLHSEEIIKHRIKCKELSEAIFPDKDINEQIEMCRNKIQTTVGAYQRQLNAVQAQVEDLKSQQRTIDTNIQNLIEKEQIPKDDNNFLQNEIELKTEEIDLQREHTTKVFDICQTEMEQKDKMMTKMCEILNNFYQLLRINGRITNSMEADYLNVLRMVQGVRSVTWQDDTEISDIKSQDSGINVNRAPSTPTPLPKPRITTIHKGTPDKLFNASERRTVKRKLYEIETKSTSAIDNFIKKHLPEPVSRTMPNLNETIVLTHSVNAEDINSTFCLHDKEPVVPKKKTALSDRSNDKLLKAATKKSTRIRKVEDRSNYKFFGAHSRMQKFPLRKNNQEQGKVEK